MSTPNLITDLTCGSIEEIKEAIQEPDGDKSTIKSYLKDALDGLPLSNIKAINAVWESFSADKPLTDKHRQALELLVADKAIMEKTRDIFARLIFIMEHNYYKKIVAIDPSQEENQEPIKSLKQSHKHALDFYKSFFKRDEEQKTVSLDNLIALIRGEGVDLDTENQLSIESLEQTSKHAAIDRITADNMSDTLKKKAKDTFDRLTAEGRLGVKSSYKGMTNVNYFQDASGQAHHRKVLTDLPLIKNHTTPYQYGSTTTQSIMRMELYGKALMDKNKRHVSDLKHNIDKLQSTEMQEYFTTLFDTTEMNICNQAKEKSLYDAMAQELGEGYTKKQMMVLTDIFLEQEGSRWLDDVDDNGDRHFVSSNAGGAHFGLSSLDGGRLGFVLAD